VPRLIPCARRRAALGATVLLLTGLAGPASASYETLKRSMGNILFGPLDVAFGPLVAAQNTYNNLQNVDDTMPVRIAYTVPGYVWNTGMQVSGGVIRVLTGCLELLPGLGLIFFDADLDPLFAPVEKSAALVDYDTPPLHFKFGLTYTE
jgi:hypothetical protein